MSTVKNGAVDVALKCRVRQDLMREPSTPCCTMMRAALIGSPMTRTPTQLAGAVLSIDLAALQSNYKALALKAGSAACGAAIKGSAYGLGVGPVSKALWDAGCRQFFGVVFYWCNGL